MHTLDKKYDAAMARMAWTTYRISGYTHDVAQDQRSAGGVHLHQVRRTRAGYQTRVLQSNGRYRAAGPVSAVSDAEGAALVATSKQS